MTQQVLRSALAGLALVLAISPTAWAASDELIQKARTTLEAGKAEKAYAKLAAREGEHAGDPEFDYWLGLAAVRAGEYGHAVFALERVLAEEPAHAGARLELTAALVALGQNKRAERQLERLATLEPPPGAAARMQKLQDAVGRRSKQVSRQDRVFHLSLETGHDNNVGTYPDDFRILPGLLPPIKTIDSAFFGARLGGTRNFTVSPDQKVGVTGQLYTREHRLGTAGQDNAGAFDQNLGSLRLRWMKDVDGRRDIEAGVEASQFQVDGDRYYNLAGLYATWRYRGAERVSWDLDLRAREIAFRADVNDYTHYSLQPGMRYQFSPRWRVGANLVFEREFADGNRPGGDAHILGLRAKTRYMLDSRNSLEVQAQYDRARYQQDFPVGTAFNPQPGGREDNRVGVTLGWAWFPNMDWRMRVQTRYRQQHSSFDLYTYQRTLGKFSVTRFF